MSGSSQVSIAQPRRSRRGWRDRIAPYAFVAPFVISFVIFFLLPSIVSVVLSFARYNGYTPIQWVGFQNYTALFTSPYFQQAIRNTLFYWLVPLVPLLGIAMLLALAVRSKLVKWGRVYKPLIFLPQVMAPVAAGLVWRVMLTNNGIVDSVAHANINWLENPGAMKWGVVLLLLWRGIGWYFIVFLAGLTGIPDDLLEAANIDGATALQRFRRIILPLLRPTILFAVVIDTIASLQLFTEPSVLLGGASGNLSASPSATPVMNQVVQSIDNGQLGLAAAVGWLMFIAIGVFSLVQFRLLRGQNR